MQFTSISFITLASLLTSVLADSEPFGVLSSHSASHVHLLPIFDAGNGLLLGSSQTTSSVDVGFTITDAGKVKLSNGKWIVLGSDGYLNDGDNENDAITGWAIQDGLVTFNGNKEFYAVPTANPLDYKISTKNVDGANFFYLLGSTAGSNVYSYTFVPSGAASETTSSVAAPVPTSTTTTLKPSATSTSSTTQPASTHTAVSTSSVAQATTTTTTTSSSSSSSAALITVSEQSENAAGRLQFGLSAGLAGVAALLL